ncbi:protein FAR1-RELATED SEQUENCE 3-like [Impatiens glandulifera]|uniref:protein FAR1-RELATED SEQUENCE 3-like n=1 Tax=Impatiens glandulifera TaxID=253017 RepID=UPI001FB13494|nr:protein FAR1-RELATED SEQUENCE 3-like [Impatiens glandulifera]XP_047311620.1 protein FAR1-RELATED SEQUENCE 3-like [Impatiens glandulifera]XP_047311621.1 protein FAR1-RELATED SEQUENCE 3-like [Impatiens glandulifera]
MEVEVKEAAKNKSRRQVLRRAKVSRNMIDNQSMSENSSEKEAANEDDDSIVKPYVGMEFESEEAAKIFYDAYARHVGFSTHVGQYSRTMPDGPIISWDFACPKEVFKRKNVESCKAMLTIERRDPNCWVVTKFVADHNHSTVSPSKVKFLRPWKHFAGAEKNVSETLDSTADVLAYTHGNNTFLDSIHGCSRSASLEPKIQITPANASDPKHITRMPANFIEPVFRKKTLGRDAQNILNYFKKMQAENPGFYYAIQLDDDNRMTNIFWADARSRIAYSRFGDAVTFDTMYRPNQYQVPFAPFTGINHHGEMVLFGCALLLDESESSFIWLFKTWLSAMNDYHPVSITTDQDRAIQVAVSQVLPETRHCICRWHILREGQERLAHIFLAHPSLYGELYNCINSSDAVEDFESTWCSLLHSYNIQKNEWLQAVYTARHQWAPVYFRDAFFGALSSNHGNRSFFDGYVNQQTILPMFFKQYERALEHSLERENEADFDTICTTPVLKTPSPMEQQAANLYTKKVFAKFQEELVETFVYTANNIEDDGFVSKYRVAKYEHDEKAYIVSVDMAEVRASCSCQMFEYSGILCRHILTVFTVTNVLTLPSHYILKRWTMNGRIGHGIDEYDAPTQGIESLTARFNSLCREAIQYAEEGAVSMETYNTAMTFLRDGAREVSAVKRTTAKITSDDSNKKNYLSTPVASPSWPWQDAIPQRFNLNAIGVPGSDLNKTSTAPISINGDNVSSDSQVVLTCFKAITWLIENQNSSVSSKAAVINLKLQDYGKIPSGENDVQFRLTKVTLEPMLKSMVYISQQLSTPTNKVAVINLKLQDINTTYGETEVKFQVSRDTLGSMLRSMSYIHEQL